MIILSQNTLLSIRRARLVVSDGSVTMFNPSLREDALAVIEGYIWLTDSIKAYAETGLSWERVRSAKAFLARAVVQFKDSEDELVERVKSSEAWALRLRSMIDVCERGL